MEEDSLDTGPRSGVALWSPSIFLRCFTGTWEPGAAVVSGSRSLGETRPGPSFSLLKGETVIVNQSHKSSAFISWVLGVTILVERAES